MIVVLAELALLVCVSVSLECVVLVGAGASRVVDADLGAWAARVKLHYRIYSVDFDLCSY